MSGWGVTGAITEARNPCTVERQGEAERKMARVGALDALLLPATTGAIREQLAECVNELALRDFPQR